MARGGARYLPYYPVSTCRTETKAEIDAVFGPLRTGPDRVEGIERHMINAKNRLEQCVVKRARYGKKIKRLISPTKPSNE